jgi:hypothetical protein
MDFDKMLEEIQADNSDAEIIKALQKLVEIQQKYIRTLEDSLATFRNERL